MIVNDFHYYSKALQLDVCRDPGYAPVMFTMKLQLSVL